VRTLKTSLITIVAALHWVRSNRKGNSSDQGSAALISEGTFSRLPGQLRQYALDLTSEGEEQQTPIRSVTGWVFENGLPIQKR
jgi:hypothetical protein